ncbi:MAG: hypothetical protein P4M01_09630 [Acidobacteriota bacterium]|nr:hypothetical protein [Acidobacteriota bacterium]
MPRMADVIRDGSAPPSLMRRGAQGSLSVPAAEAVEILLMMAADHDYGAEAEQTLANWDEASLVAVAGDANTPVEVLAELLQRMSSRAPVVEALCENPAMPWGELEGIASRADENMLQAMMNSARVRSSSRLLDLMMANSASASHRPRLTQWLSSAEGKEADEVAAHFLARHADDVHRESGFAFELVPPPDGEEDPLGTLMTRAKRGDQPDNPEDCAQLSLLQRLARMRTGERIKLAVKGSREERMVLIRDRSKLVSLAVLESPKVSEQEMESFAAMKNIQESVLRSIAGKRNYMKNYNVLRALVNNPKTPLDTALPLIQHLLLKDQRALAINKNVNETLRKMALRIWRMKTERKKDD